MNAIIMAALESFGDPVVFGEYAPGNADAERYYTFGYSTIPADHSDDSPGHERYLVQICLNCPRSFNSLQRVAETKKALFSAGFTWPSVVNASDEEGQRIVFECEGVSASDID